MEEVKEAKTRHCFELIRGQGHGLGAHEVKVVKGPLGGRRSEVEELGLDCFEFDEVKVTATRSRSWVALDEAKGLGLDGLVCL